MEEPTPKEIAKAKKEFNKLMNYFMGQTLKANPNFCQHKTRGIIQDIQDKLAAKIARDDNV